MAALELASSAPQEALEQYRRAIDFEGVPDAHVDLAAAYLLSGHTDEALSEVTNALLNNPQNARAWHISGRAWILKRNYRQAIDSLQRSAVLEPSPDVSRVLTQVRAASAGRRAQITQAKPQDLVAMPPLKQAAMRTILANSLNDLGTSEARQQQFSLALAHFHEAEQWDANTPGLMRNIGFAAARTGDYKEVVRALRPVVSANPRDEVARTLLATALFSTGAFADAANIFAPLRDSALDNPEVAYTWASSLVKSSRYPEASSLLDKLEQRQLSTEYLMLIAQAWSQMDNYARTISTLRRALQVDPHLPRAHYIAGLALIREDKPAEAEQEFRGELQLDSENVDAQYHLAFVLLQQAKVDEAVRYLRSVLERKPDHPEANYELGKQLLADSKPADAIPYLEAAARLKPQLEPVHYQLQAAYRAVGRKEDADREARVYREMKARSRNITLPPPREQETEAAPQ